MYRFQILACSMFVAATTFFSAGCDGECLTEAEFEANPACEDPDRGHIVGQITVPGATQSGWGTGQQMPDWIGEVSEVLAQDFRTATEQADPKKWGKAQIRQRDSNRVGPERSRTMNWRTGEVIVRGASPIRHRRGDFEAYLDAFLGAQFEVEIGLCNTDSSCLHLSCTMLK